MNLLSSDPHAMMIAAIDPHARTENRMFREERFIVPPLVEGNVPRHPPTDLGSKGMQLSRVKHTPSTTSDGRHPIHHGVRVYRLPGMK